VKRVLIAAAVLSLLLGASPRRLDSGHEDSGGDNQASSSIQGVVFDVNGTSIRILGGTVAIESTGVAIVSSQDDKPLTLGDIKPGQIIDVEGSLQGTGFAASRITVEGIKFDGQLSGAVDAVDLVTQRLRILGVTVSVTPDTMFEFGGHGSGTLSSITAGMRTDIEVVVAGKALVATRIQVQDDQQQEGEH
jgi:hypothetical protein